MVLHMRAREQILHMIANAWKIRKTLQFLPYGRPSLLQPHDLKTMHHHVVTISHMGEQCCLVLCKLNFCNRYIAVIVYNDLTIYQLQVRAPKKLFKHGSIFTAELNWSRQHNKHHLRVMDVIMCAGVTTHQRYFNDRHKLLCQYFNYPPQRQHVAALDMNKIEILVQTWVPMRCFDGVVRQANKDTTKRQYLFIPTNAALRFALLRNTYFWTEQPRMCLYYNDGQIYCLNHTYECDVLEDLLPNIQWHFIVPTSKEAFLMWVHLDVEQMPQVTVSFWKKALTMKYPDHVTYIKHLIEATPVSLNQILSSTTTPHNHSTR